MLRYLKHAVKVSGKIAAVSSYTYIRMSRLTALWSETGHHIVAITQNKGRDGGRDHSKHCLPAEKGVPRRDRRGSGNTSEIRSLRGQSRSVSGQAPQQPLTSQLVCSEACADTETFIRCWVTVAGMQVDSGHDNAPSTAAPLNPLILNVCWHNKVGLSSCAVASALTAVRPLPMLRRKLLLNHVMKRDYVCWPLSN